MFVGRLNVKFGPVDGLFSFRGLGWRKLCKLGLFFSKQPFDGRARRIVERGLKKLQVVRNVQFGNFTLA